MIITRTPYRVSLFGGGTDYPSYYRERGGVVLGFALNRYAYLTVRRLPPFFSHRHRIVWSRVETVMTADGIEHPAVRAILQSLDSLIGDDGLEVHYDGDLPAMSGVGSSSSFTVGLLNAITALYGEPWSPGKLADRAIWLERDVIGDAVGDQDQIFAAMGGFLHVELTAAGRSVRPAKVTRERERELLDHLLLVYTGLSRRASDIAREQVSRTGLNLSLLDRMKELAREAISIVEGNGPIAALGDLLHRSWVLKRSLTVSITTELVDGIYQRALEAGAIGGKLLGAGGGGFMLLFVPPAARDRVIASLPAGTVIVPVGIDRYGSRVVLNEPNGL